MLHNVKVIKKVLSEFDLKRHSLMKMIAVASKTVTVVKGHE